MDHRGACGCEANTGDGAGMLTAIPDELMRAEAQRLFNAELPEIGRYAIAQVFLPRDENERELCKSNLQKYVEAQGQRFIGWRRVPTDAKKADIGATAAAGEPVIEQMFVAAGRQGSTARAFCRQLYLIRKQAFHALKKHDAQAAAACTTSPASARGSSSTRGSSRRSRSCRIFPTWPTRATPATWRWSIRGSAPTRSRRGSGPSRCGSCATTARSTRSAATSTGWRPAKGCSNRSCSATT